MKKDKKRIIEAIVIGASAGGVKALLDVLPPLPLHYCLPIIVVLHIPEKGKSNLAEVFQYHAKLTVRQAQDKEHIEPGCIYFAGSGYHLSIEDDRSFSLSGEDPINFSRPSIDLLMKSAADVYGERLAGFLLTGANDDGAEGLAYIKDAGGLTIVQNPNEAEISIMPKAAIHLQQPDMILSLHEIQALLVELGT